MQSKLRSKVNNSIYYLFNRRYFNKVGLGDERGNEMSEVKSKLGEMIARVRRLDACCNSMPHNIDFIVEEYKNIKLFLRGESDKWQLSKTEKTASDDEKTFYYPALSEAYLALKVKIGSRNTEDISLCLYDALFSLRDYFDQMDT